MLPARNRRALCGLLLLCMAGLAGCSSGRVNMWPLFFHEVRQVNTPAGPKIVTSTDVLYPIFHRESEPGTSWYAVRPFYNYQYGPEAGRHQVQYLWPLGLYFKDGARITEVRLWLLFHYISAWSDMYQRYSTHAHVLQLLRWGNDAEFGPYAALIPLAGVTHNVIGETWSFLLFPLYSHYRQGDYVRNDFPWPILGFGTSPGNHKVMYRFFPLYVYQRNENARGLYMRQDVVWPLVRWGKLDVKGDYYGTVFAVTPFFSLVQTWNRQGKEVAHKVSVLGVSFGSDTRPNQGGWGALWSLFEGQSQPMRDDVRFLPFYWKTTFYRTTAKDPATSWTRVRAPWPIVWLDDNHFEPDVEHKAYFVVPFYWHYTDVYRKSGEPGQVARRITLWPLATWARDKDGAHHVWVLSHGWNDTTHGYERNYRAFFDVFQYHSSAQGESEVRVVSRLYHQRSTPTGSYLSVAGLFTYDSTGEVVGQEGKYVSALFDLVKCSWTEQKHHWRIFFIPIN